MDEITIDLRCCCCGRLIDTLKTDWSFELVAPVDLFTREPCNPCKLDLATESLLRTAARHDVPVHIVTYDPGD